MEILTVKMFFLYVIKSCCSQYLCFGVYILSMPKFVGNFIFILVGLHITESGLSIVIVVVTCSMPSYSI